MTESVKYIKRHSGLQRTWHWSNIICAAFLTITGLFLFTPLGDIMGTNALLVGKIVHRIFGAIFAGMFFLYIIVRPSEFIHSMKHIFAKWTDDDKLFMKDFFKYLLNAKKYHMPKQDFVKSGQRVSDFFMYLIIIMFIFTGIVLWLGTARGLPQWFVTFCLMGHDLCFMGFCMLMIFHIYLGGGIFEPYTKRAALWMLGSGYVSSSDALYHWGQWAEDALESGEGVVEVPDGMTVSETLRRKHRAENAHKA